MLPSFDVFESDVGDVICECDVSLSLSLCLSVCAGLAVCLFCSGFFVKRLVSPLLWEDLQELKGIQQARCV